MATITLRGREYNYNPITANHYRYATLYRNNIVSILRKIGTKEDDVICDIEPAAFKKAPASASWYHDGRHLHYSCNKCGRYVDNLCLVSKVIEHYVTELINDRLTLSEFYEEFVEEQDVKGSRVEARKELGLDEETEDFEAITKAYKTMAKQHHPDMPDGDEDKFKAINKAHKTLKRELT